jgi:hypothetical protein
MTQTIPMTTMISALSLLVVLGFATAAGAAQPTVPAAVPASPHQAQDVTEMSGQFDTLDTNRDGHLSHSEAGKLAPLASYWKEKDLGKDHNMDRAEFAQYRSVENQGTNIYTEVLRFSGGCART